MAKVILDNIGVSLEELKTLALPVQEEDGSIKHMNKFLVDNQRLMKLVNETALPKNTKRKMHITIVKLIDTLNMCGVYKYIPDKYKPVLPLIFAMDIINDEDFIKMLEEK